MSTSDPVPSERICPKCGWAIAPGEVECSTCQRIDRLKPRRGSLLAFLDEWLVRHPLAFKAPANILSLASPALGLWAVYKTSSLAVCIGLELCAGFAIAWLYWKGDGCRVSGGLIVKMTIWLIYTGLVIFAFFFVDALIGMAGPRT